MNSVGFREETPDLDALRDRLRKMTDAELVTFGKQAHDLCYPLRYGYDGKPMKCWFWTELLEARKEWRWRKRGGRFFLISSIAR